MQWAITKLTLHQSSAKVWMSELRNKRSEFIPIIGCNGRGGLPEFGVTPNFGSFFYNDDFQQQ